MTSTAATSQLDDLQAAAIEHAMRTTGDIAAVVRFADALARDTFSTRVALGRLVSASPGAVPAPGTPLAAVALGCCEWDRQWRLRVPAEPGSIWQTREQLAALSGEVGDRDPLGGYWELVESADRLWTEN